MKLKKLIGALTPKEKRKLLTLLTEGEKSVKEAPHIEMVYVHGGSFTMGCTSEQGSGCYESEKPAHSVTLSNFYIGKYPVTQAQWEAVMGSNPSHFQGCDDCPVEMVSWNSIQEFIKKLNELTGAKYRLPTEAEWEYAARGGNRSKGYKYAGSNNPDEVVWHHFNSGDKPHSIGSKSPNELGIYDMSGNVWEWCSDWYGDYTSAAQTNPKGADSGKSKVLRGGSWNFLPRDCRVSNRYDSNPGSRYNLYGFRLAL